jgi:anti-anti-sigma factor
MPRRNTNRFGSDLLSTRQVLSDVAFRCLIQLFLTIGWHAALILPLMLEKEFSYETSDGNKEGTVILTLVGPLLLNNMFGFQNELRAMKPPCLIMDFTQVPFMDSAGLGVIMNYYVSAESAGRKLFLAGINERVRALLEMTKVDSVLPIFDSVETAQAKA